MVPWLLALLTLAAAAALHGAAMRLFRRRAADWAGAHALITGGSKGIGLALGEELAARGAAVTVLARGAADLAAARAALRAAAAAAGRAPRALALAADTTDAAALAAALAEAEAAFGPVDTLVACAGLAIPGLFVEQPLADFERQVSVNYLGAVRAVKAALPGMLARRRGRVVLVSSPLCTAGFAGYASYAPTKAALRALGDCLRSELQGTGVRVAVAYPPDTDTPGFAAENLTKPPLCKAVNAALGSELFPARRVAARIAARLDAGHYHLDTPDLGTNLLLASAHGLAPKSLPAPLGCFLAPAIHVAAGVAGWLGDRAARRHHAAHGYSTYQPPGGGGGGR
jgi:3-dehydrosphinganine reductase